MAAFFGASRHWVVQADFLAHLSRITLPSGVRFPIPEVQHCIHDTGRDTVGTGHERDGAGGDGTEWSADSTTQSSTATCDASRLGSHVDGTLHRRELSPRGIGTGAGRRDGTRISGAAFAAGANDELVAPRPPEFLAENVQCKSGRDEEYGVLIGCDEGGLHRRH